MKKLILFIVFIILAGGLAFFFQDQQKRKDNSKKTVEETAKEGISVPSDLTACTPELMAQNCDEVKQETVCGYDHTTYESGEKRNNVLQFKSACHYCKFYGLEEKDIGGTRIRGLGYEIGPCTQGMYKD
jgi:hypothetical protein